MRTSVSKSGPQSHHFSATVDETTYSSAILNKVLQVSNSHRCPAVAGTNAMLANQTLALVCESRISEAGSRDVRDSRADELDLAGVGLHPFLPSRDSCVHRHICLTHQIGLVEPAVRDRETKYAIVEAFSF